MNIGVYYRNNVNPAWVEHATGLPLVAVNEVEVQQSGGKLRVATYGRGIWDLELNKVPVTVATANFEEKSDVFKVYPNLVTQNGIIHVESTLTEPFTIDIFNIKGSLVFTQKITIEIFSTFWQKCIRKIILLNFPKKKKSF
jgi:hypothetical protein